MIETPKHKIQLSTIQSNLASFSNSQQQQEYLNKIINEQIYTNLELAKALQTIQYKILLSQKNEALELAYILNQAFIENQEYEYQKSEQTYSKAIPVIEDLGSDDLKASTYTDYAGVFVNLGKYEEAEKYLNKAITLLSEKPDNMLHGYIKCRFGHIALARMDYPTATEFFLQAQNIITRKINIQLKDKLFLSYVYNGLGEVYDRIGDIQKSVGYRKSALSICKTNPTDKELIVDVVAPVSHK